MKKLVVFLLVCSLVMVVAGSALANAPKLKLDKATTPVFAWVWPYAHVCWIKADTLHFSGRAFETKYGKATYYVESNCPIIAKTEGGDFRLGYFKLETDYGNSFGRYPYEAGQEFISLQTHFMGKKFEDVYYKAQTGRITDQPAGLYTTYLTTTVYTNF